MAKLRYKLVTDEPRDAARLIDRFFLYIDILGFADLVMNSPDRVADLYEIVSSLNAHRHGSFGTIVFSDTILIYPKFKSGIGKQADSYFIMYLCEFAQDLMYRMRNRDIYFRAVITQGKFTHYILNNIPCFYGPALVDAYNSEKKIKAVGLFIDSRCALKSTLFHTQPFNDKYDYVHLWQSMEIFQPHGVYAFPYPDPSSFEEEDYQWELARDALIFSNIARNRNHPDPDVGEKHRNTWDLLYNRYPKVLGQLEAANFDPRVFCPGMDWSESIKRAKLD
jgi:hypothetical protein